MSRSLAATPPPEGEIPEGWEVAQVGDIFDSWGGATPSTSEKAYWGGSIPWISSKDVKTWRVTNGTDFVTKRAVAETRLRPCRSGTVLVVVRSGVLVHTLPVSIVEADVVINQDVKAFSCPERTLNEWLALFLRADASQILAENRKDGTTVQSVGLEKLKALSFPVPPLTEQKRILAKVEELLARVNAARERLAHVPIILKRIRQAVLAVACDGRLTEEWRQRQGTRETVREGELPDTWKTVESSKLFEFVTTGSRGWARYYSDHGPLFLRVGNLDHDSIRLDLQNVQHVLPPRNQEAERTRVNAQDLLVTVTAEVGMVAVVPEGLGDAYVNQHVAIARPSKDVNVEFLAWFLTSPEGGQRQFAELKRGATKAGLGLDDIRSLQVPQPPVGEQEEIVRHLEALFKLADTIEKRVAAATARAERLTQAILAKAFRGELVPTEAELARREGREYDGAAILLGRLRAERSLSEGAPRRPRRQQDGLNRHGKGDREALKPSRRRKD